MDRWHLGRASHSPGPGDKAPGDEREGEGVRFGAVEQKALLEPNLKIMNLRERLHMIS